MIHAKNHQVPRSLTPLYCVHQAAYFFAIAGVGAFAVAYLTDRGFDAAQTGVMLASTNILSCALQPLIGSYVDRKSRSLLRGIILFCLSAALCAFACAELLPLPRLFKGLLFIFGSLTFSLSVPLSNSLCAYYSQNGYHIDYGAGSGVGSLSFSFASLAFGYIIAALGVRAMIVTALAFITLEIVLTLRYPYVEDRTAARMQHGHRSLSIPAFCRRYRLFMLTMLGVMCLSACHVMAENFLIQLFERVGGGSEHVGLSLFLACTTAAPLLLFFERIQNRTGVVILLRLSGIFYIAKALLLIWAPSIASICVIELVQTFTYGFLYPSLYYLVIRRIDPADMAKGQMLASSMYTLGTAMGNSLGGSAIEYLGLNAMLLLAAGIAMAGTLLINTMIGKADPRR